MMTSRAAGITPAFVILGPRKRVRNPFRMIEIQICIKTKNLKPFRIIHFSKNRGEPDIVNCACPPESWRGPDEGSASRATIERGISFGDKGPHLQTQRRVRIARSRIRGEESAFSPAGEACPHQRVTSSH